MAPTHSTATSTRVAEKLYLENTLLRVAGALFCHDAKRAAIHTEEIELNRGVAEKNIVIRPDPRMGQPGPLAHKIFVAILKKHSNYGRPIRPEVSFSKRELMRLIGRKRWGGRDSEQLTRALNEIHYTFVRTSFRGAAGRHVEHSFSVFPEIYLERADAATDPIERCAVTLARPIVASLQDEHFTCLNYALMQQLGTIGQAIYMRLFFHFATLYDGHHRSRLTFPKRYSAICSEWLGGLTVQEHRSVIERDQLGPHLRQLIDLEFLASYSVTKAARGDGFVITFRPGAVFFADYDRFYRGRGERDFQFAFHDDRQQVAEPLKVAYLFIEKRTGQPIKSIPYVSSREVDTARAILTQVPFEEMPYFLEFALSEARKTKFDVQSLGGLKQYVTGFLADQRRRADMKAAQSARAALEREEADRLAYDCFRRETAQELFARLPRSEQQIIVELAQGRNRPLPANGPLADMLGTLAKQRITAERHSDKIPTFEAWKAGRHVAGAQQQ